ncbi:MAG: hypothetical protein J6Z35_10465 [Lachnospiraceae bacterium]|nr:hypothetical protein [Lachnospiraceae bacterium]
MNEHKPKIIVVSLRMLLIRIAMALAGFAVVMTVNKSWILYFQHLFAETMPEVLRLMPLSTGAATVLWILAGIFASFASASCFWHQHSIAGALILGGYAFFGYALMYLYPVHLILLAVRISRFISAGRARMQSKQMVRKNEGTNAENASHGDDTEELGPR